MNLHEDKAVIELLKEVRILKRQLGLINRDLLVVSLDDLMRIQVALGSLSKEIVALTERSINNRVYGS